VDARTGKMRADTKEPASVNEAGSWMSARAEMKVRRTPLRLEAAAMAALAASTWFVLALDNSVDPLFSRNLITVFFTVNRWRKIFPCAETLRRVRNLAAGDHALPMRDAPDA
jgi:hypothetical protein